MRSSKRDFFMYAMIIASILFVYGNAATFDFIDLDDNFYVIDNWHVKQGVTIDNIHWSLTTIAGELWHPITWISYMIDFEIYGMDPGGYHITNVLFHILNSILIFVILKKMTKTYWRAGSVAFLFAVHPLHVESVAWISERKDVLSAFFWLLAISSYIDYCNNHRRDRYLLATLFFLLAGMSKPMVVTLPFVLLLLDYWPLQRIFYASDYSGEKKENIFFRIICEKIPLIIISGALSAATIAAHKTGIINDNPATIRIGNILTSYFNYLAKTILPYNLCIFYPYPKTINLWVVLVVAAILFYVTLLAISYRNKKPYFFVGWFWYVVTLIPVAGIVNIGSHAMADRYTYIPLIGVFIILSWGVTDITILIKEKQRKILLICLEIALILQIIISEKQAGYFETSIKIFEHTLASTNDNYVIHNALGLAFFRIGRKKDAIKQYEESIRINSDFEISYANKSALLFSDKETRENCISFCKDIIKKRPDFVNVQCNLAVALLKLGRLDESYIHFVDILRKKPDIAKAYYYIGGIMSLKGNKAESKLFFEKALSINPYVAEENN